MAQEYQQLEYRACTLINFKYVSATVITSKKLLSRFITG